MSMSMTPTSELQRFRDFLVGFLQKNPMDRSSPEEILDVWRSGNPCPDDYQETVRALRIAIDSLATDPGMTLEEFDRSFRAEHPRLSTK